MSSNADRFTGRVDEYEKYRLGYPAAVLEILRERCGLRPKDVIADVGAGTGMVAKMFLDAGHEVFAVEPNAEMRAACGRGLGAYAGLRMLDAGAEATGLDACSVDMVCVGRAFHWFDQARAVAEFRRVLKPGRWVVVLSNGRKRIGSAQAEAFEALLTKDGTDVGAVRARLRSYAALDVYGGEHFDVVLPDAEELTIEALLGQARSYSITPLPGQPGYAEMQAALRAFFATWSENGRLRMETECRVSGWKTPG